MFEGLLENMKEQQAAMQKKLQALEVSSSLQGITIQGNANLDISQIQIDDALVDITRKEELIDLLITCISEWKDKVEKQASEISENLVNDMMPPGFDDMFKNLK
ncbi:MAG: YbaB/EbfC family nucleoid-associated protein [Saprospiraceae bacterium]|nr:YbaB/EbfC family nucleoid-associated protein [Saprospiraceae bacterium]MBK6566604.1 YbaB/EbfC family nucleoid-associated protein [Saprospiraceae bacterium]MBK6785101.1 YbaB/EbfC family nucleoid-associated protein [Saprospiraceae bacterium]MBK7525593.1 YbaB/EbfC family nucleoid-associated protein [Saprospiraceae bacterium]MBK8081068.1 YbaB/EbfC family nucleoid-associated protein [Saprospiraceae bacterium]